MWPALQGDTVEAALRGIHFIFSLSRDDNNLARFGSDLVQVEEGSSGTLDNAEIASV